MPDTGIFGETVLAAMFAGAYAQLLGNSEADRLLQQTLAEEMATDKALTALGEGGINQAAVAAGAGAEEEE